jgi:hypothetical protein
VHCSSHLCISRQVRLLLLLSLGSLVAAMLLLAARVVLVLVLVVQFMVLA